MNILHILNGDDTLKGFEETGLDGDTMIWRGILSEGPVEEDIASGSFWRNRAEWIGQTLNDTPENYQKRMLDHLALLGETFDEIDLWFEFDLHCQVNLLGVMTYLKSKADLSAPSIYLICPADYPGKENFRGMGELNGEELEYLYDNIRVQLSGIDFIIAEEAWKIYVSKDLQKLKDYVTTNTFWGNLHQLKPALEAEVLRLEKNELGLNYVEQKLLSIYNSGSKTEPEIYKAFWTTEKIFGMGDMEINIYLNRLREKGLID